MTPAYVVGRLRDYVADAIANAIANASRRVDFTPDQRIVCGEHGTQIMHKGRCPFGQLCAWQYPAKFKRKET